MSVFLVLVVSIACDESGTEMPEPTATQSAGSDGKVTISATFTTQQLWLGILGTIAGVEFIILLVIFLLRHKQRSAIDTELSMLKDSEAAVSVASAKLCERCDTLSKVAGWLVDLTTDTRLKNEIKEQLSLISAETKARIEQQRQEYGAYMLSRIQVMEAPAPPTVIEV